MGTRADFYVRIKKAPQQIEMKWLGSVAFDGYPEGFDEDAGMLALTATNQQEFEAAVAEALSTRRSATTPEMGWPWPWEDSLTTDYAYVFDEGKVNGFCFGCPFDLQKRIAFGNEDDDGEGANAKEATGYFPDMSSIKNVTYGERSGLIVIQG